MKEEVPLEQPQKRLKQTLSQQLRKLEEQKKQIQDDILLMAPIDDAFMNHPELQKNITKVVEHIFSKWGGSSVLISSVNGPLKLESENPATEHRSSLLSENEHPAITELLASNL